MLVETSIFSFVQVQKISILFIKLFSYFPSHWLQFGLYDILYNLFFLNIFLGLFSRLVFAKI